MNWAAMLLLAAQGLGMTPEEFWRLTPAEFFLLTGLSARDMPLSHSRLAAMMEQFPDAGGEHG